MSPKAYSGFGKRKTPQNQSIPGKDQVLNSAGGYSWKIDDWKRLDRFLILGSENGTYYIQESALTKDCAEAVLRCISTDGERVVRRIVEISEAGRATKNDPALFALALCASFGDEQTRKFAFASLPKVARIGTHLFSFLEYCKGSRGWGRGIRESVADWYNSKTASDLAYQVIKYKQRGSWSHRDTLRLSHPKAMTPEHNAIYHWITQGELRQGIPAMIEAYEKVQKAETSSEVIQLIDEFNLPREAIPTRFLNDRGVWGALLLRMPMTAMVRNLAKMTSVGLLQPMSDSVKHIEKRLTDPILLKESRVHPISILIALETYKKGNGLRGKLEWNPTQDIVDALDSAFYQSFNFLEPIGKTTILAIDASGSMNSYLSGYPITCRKAAVALALVTANIEKDYVILGYTCDDHVVSIPISPRQRLDDALATFERVIDPNGTDCSLPFKWAKDNQVKADAIIQYTDSETWAGEIHPQQALEDYRRSTKKAVKMVVVGMVANSSSIGDNDDDGILDVVGFDTSTPDVISDFCRE